MTTRPPCEGVTKAGSACRSFVAVGDLYCFPHNPSNAERMQQARAAGASKGGKVRALKSHQPRFDTPKALIRFTGLILGGVLSGRIAPDVGRCVLYGINTQRQLIESADVERRLAALEAQLQQQGGTKRWA